MMLFFLTCLLAVFPVVSTKSPIFGPQEVRKIEGRSADITCFYPDTSVNRHTRKYWCRQGAQGTCTTKISSDSYISKDYQDRSSIINFPETNTFVVNIAKLTTNDTGKYKCGLGINTRGLSFDVALNVFQGKDPASWGGIEIYTLDMGDTLTVDCPFKSEHASSKKSVYWKSNNKDYVLIADSEDEYNIDPAFEGRLKLQYYGTSELKFTLIIKQVRPSDAGTYMCLAGDDFQGPNGGKEVDLQVLTPGPQLAYADLRGSVTFNCTLGSNVDNEAKFLCRMNKTKQCNVVINTLGTKDPAFEGRILLTPQNSSSFSVLMVGLRKEDTGHYLCGAHGSGELQEGASSQAWHLFVNEETSIPARPSVVKGVKGGSVSVRCPYNPKERDSLKYWCRWENTQSGSCPLLVQSSAGVVPEQHENYKGRLALYEEPGNGTYTVILNQLTAQDAGIYWCLTSGDDGWTTTVELQVVDGEPNLKVPKDVTAWEEESLKLPCNVSCRFYSSEKYWCKWTDKGCRTLPSQDEGPSQAFANCGQNSQLISLILNPVTKDDEGWYWCGVKDGPQYKETVAVHVTVNKRVKAGGRRDVNQVIAAPDKEVREPSVRKIENKVNQDPSLIQDPSLFAEDRAVKDSGSPDDGGKASPETSSSAGQGGSSTVLVSTLVPLALVLALGAVALAVARARHRRNVDQVSIRSYRTDISMSDLENSRDFGGNDNMGAFPDNQETSLGRKDETITTTENTMETEEPKKAKRSSKEEADMAYAAFLHQSNDMAARIHDSPSEA
ncbi:polymeric immunoglobulin receptor [Talpa occidentalis]|uniref:polymeric immunoglobulin receptor n=1 Tax=Talpa occidentalis TaxID=50954 RepID=UPI0023F78707|nr:polymeric immunoglobulin receptor [Talpa occidentalis]